ncbi:MAG: hypothetical protein AABW80_01785 [Nanoarchaeota archaeon]
MKPKARGDKLGEGSMKPNQEVITQGGNLANFSDNVTFLTPVHESLKIKGKLMYSEGDQAWNTLRLKKEILMQYPHLKDKSASNFIYLMELHRNFDELKKQIETLEKENSLIPIIFFLGKENNKM